MSEVDARPFLSSSQSSSASIYGSNSGSSYLEDGDRGGNRSSSSSGSSSSNEGLKVRRSTSTVVNNPTASLGTLSLALISFASIAGGPFGIEDSVATIGPLFSMLGMCAIAICWSLPQAMLTAELSTAFPSDAGASAWVVHGLGPVLGFVSAWNSNLCALCNLPLYPILFVQYVRRMLPQMVTLYAVLIKLFSLLVTVYINLSGISFVEKAGSFFTVMAQIPFILIPLVAWAQNRPFDWGANLDVPSNWKDNAGIGIATLCWNSQGWVNIGNLVSEVREPETSYPRGVSLSILLVTLNYVYPIALCFALYPSVSSWTTGYFSTIGDDLGVWLGVIVTLGAACSCLNNFQPQMACTSRALRYTVLYGMVPFAGTSLKAKYIDPLPDVDELAPAETVGATPKEIKKMKHEKKKRSFSLKRYTEQQNSRLSGSVVVEGGYWSSSDGSGSSGSDAEAISAVVGAVGIHGRPRAESKTQSNIANQISTPPKGEILFQAFIAGALCALEYEDLVIINGMFYNIAVLLQFLSFIVLKYTQPNLKRPYTVPGGMWGAWGILFLFFPMFGLYTFITVQTVWAMYIVAAVNCFLLCGALYWRKYDYNPEDFVGDHELMEPNRDDM